MYKNQYLIIFSLIGAAPFWQSGLDALSAGLGSALLVLLLTTAIRTTSAAIDSKDFSR